MVERSGLIDVGVVLSDAADGNCFSGNTFSTSAPANIEQVMPCDAAGTGDFTTGAVDIGEFLDTTGNAKGVGYTAVAGAEAPAEHAPGLDRQGASGGRTGSGRPRRDPGAGWQLGQVPAR